MLFGSELHVHASFRQGVAPTRGIRDIDVLSYKHSNAVWRYMLTAYNFLNTCMCIKRYVYMYMCIEPCTSVHHVQDVVRRYFKDNEAIP